MGTESQLGEAFVPIRATLDKLDGDLKQARSKVEGAMKGMEDKTGKAGGALKALGTNVNNLKNQVPALGTAFNLLTNPITLAAGGLAIFSGIAKDSIGIASDLSETVSKVGIVFGDEADQVMDFGKKAAASLGMSENAALSAAGVYGNLFRSMEMGEDVSAKMSVGLVQLAGDLASFNNMDPTVVADKLRAMLSGETEPGKSLGININEVTIKERALELALWDGIGALDASAKAQAVYSLIMEQTTLAQGDFARTSSGLANQQRIQKAETENLKAALGELLLPTTVTVTSAFVDFVQILNGTYDAAQHAEDGISFLDKAMGRLEAGVEGLKMAGNILAYFGAVANKVFTGGATPEVIARLREQYFGLHQDVKVLAEEEDRLIAVQNQLTPTMADAAENGVAPLVGDMKDLHAQAALTSVRIAGEFTQSLIDAKIAAQKLVDDGIKYLDTTINSRLGPEMEKFTEGQGDLEQQMRDIQTAIDKAISEGYDPLGKKVLGLKGDYDALKGQYTANEKEHDRASKEIMFDLMEQAMAIGGFTDTERLALEAIAKDWGLPYQATVDYLAKQEEALTYLATTGDTAGFLAIMNNQTTSWSLAKDQANFAASAAANYLGNLILIDGKVVNTTIFTHYVNDESMAPSGPPPGPGYSWNGREWVKGPGGASGLDMIVPGNFPNDTFPVMASSGERVIIMPQSERMELKMVDTFGGAGMAMADHRNQLQPAAEPFTINLYAVPEKEKDMRRQARYIVDEIKRRGS